MFEDIVRIHFENGLRHVRAVGFNQGLSLSGQQEVTDFVTCLGLDTHVNPNQIPSEDERPYFAPILTKFDEVEMVKLIKEGARRETTVRLVSSKFSPSECASRLSEFKRVHDK